MDALKPFLMLACAAFVVGFVGYLGLSRLATTNEAPVAAQAQAEAQAQTQDPQSSTASAPASADDWNAGKLI